MPGKNTSTKNTSSLAEYRQARHLYTILDTLEAGIVLHGSEVCALRQHRASLSGAFIVAGRRDLTLHNLTITPCDSTPRAFCHSPQRIRQLLVHRREHHRLTGKSREQGITLIPLRIYSGSRGYIKVLVGLAKGKTKHDQRETEKKRAWQRRQQQLLRR